MFGICIVVDQNQCILSRGVDIANTREFSRRTLIIIDTNEFKKLWLLFEMAVNPPSS
jgi:hypothetical protein